MTDSSCSSYSTEGEVDCFFTEIFDSSSSSDEPYTEDTGTAIPPASFQLLEEHVNKILTTLEFGISELIGQIYPMTWREYLTNNYSALTNGVIDVAKNRDSWVLVDDSFFQRLSKVETKKRPQSLLCDIFIISNSHPLLLLSIMTSTTRKTCLMEYNSRLARGFRNIVQSAGVEKYDLVNGIFSIAGSELQQCIDRLETEAVHTSMPHSLKMDTNRYKHIISSIMSMVDVSVERFATPNSDTPEVISVTQDGKELSQAEKKDASSHADTRSFEEDTMCTHVASIKLEEQSDVVAKEETVDIKEFKRMKQKVLQLELDMRVLKWQRFDEHLPEHESSSDTGFESYETATESPNETKASQGRLFRTKTRPRRPPSPSSTITTGYIESTTGSSEEETISNSEILLYDDAVKEITRSSKTQKTYSNDDKLDSYSAPEADCSTNILSELPIKDVKTDMQTFIFTGKSMKKINKKNETIVSTADSPAFDHTALHDACRHGNLQLVKDILSLGKGDINSRDKLGVTPVMLAAGKGNREVFDLLVSKGADVTVMDNNINTILHIACLGDKEEFVKYLLALNIADINVKNLKGRTPLMAAAYSGCRKVFDLLVSQGADLSVVDDNKDTILNVACYVNNVEFVKYILTLTISDINVRGQWGRTPVTQAAGNGCRTVFDLLVDQGADLSVVDDNKDTILNVACLADNIEFVKHILKMNLTNINVRGNLGRTPVMLAAIKGCRRVFDLLLTQGADLQVLDDNKDTILHVACLKDNIEFVKYLLTLNIVDINVRGQSGMIPVMMAATKGCRKVFDLLVNQGADLSVVDDKRDTILNIASMEDNLQFVKYLLTLNIADINVRGQLGMTPVMMAATKGCRKVFDLLVSQGADLSVVDDNRNTILHVACLEDNLEFVTYLLTLNIADINVRGQLGMTPVMIAAINGCRRVYDLLVGQGADLSVVGYQKNTILNVACYEDHVEFLKYLLTLNIADINVRGELGRTPVMQAAGNGCRKVFDLLVTEGADLSVVDDYKDTILNVACLEDNLQFVKYLLTLNIADINIRGQWGRTPVMQAANKGCVRVFDLLVSQGANLSVVDDNKDTILNVACYVDNPEFVKYLFTLNIADINIRGQWGRTPVMQAANNGCVRVFDLLVSEGANLSVVDDNKDTILHVACYLDNPEFVKCLFTLNIAGINVRGQWGNTPAMQAAGNGCRKVFDLLVTEGADLSMVDDNKNTILNIACLADNVEFVKYLFTLNIADINVRGQLERTPVMQAAFFGYTNIFEFLVSLGADLSVLDEEKSTILHLASCGGNVEIVKYLLSLDRLDINSKTRGGQTPAQVAKRFDRKEVFDILVENGCKVDKIDSPCVTT